MTIGESIQQLSPTFKRWVDLKTVNVSELKILWFLFNESAHTRTKIAIELNLWKDKAVMILEHLRKEGFIFDDQIFFGGRMINIYQLTELGRFILYNSNLMSSPGIA